MTFSTADLLFYSSSVVIGALAPYCLWEWPIYIRLVAFIMANFVSYEIIHAVCSN